MTGEEPRLRVLEQHVAASRRGNTVLVVLAGLLAVGAAAAFAVTIVTDASVTLQGTALAIAAFLLAFAVRRGFAATFPQVVAAEERTMPQARGSGLAEVQPVGRRGFLLRFVGGVAALLGLSLLAPVTSIGTPREQRPTRTSWRHGLRVVDPEGEPLRPAEITEVALGWPEGAAHRELDSVVVVRLAEQPQAPTNLDWVVDGSLVAYSKICTHAGCPVGLFQEGGRLFCPCHQAEFDAVRGAEPVLGPAARGLPQLPLGVDGEGYLVALGDFPEPAGPYVGGGPQS